MTPTLHSFIDMTLTDRADFFAKCQEILLKKHPDSEYLATEEKIDLYKEVFKKYHSNYKGFCYQSDGTCLLYNHVKLPPKPDYNELAKSLIYKFPAKDYNAISIDFLTSMDIKECLSIYAKIVTPSMKHIIYLKGDGIKIFPLSSDLKSTRSIASMFKI